MGVLLNGGEAELINKVFPGGSDSFLHLGL